MAVAAASPDRVIVGEIRGPEVIPLTNAMSMGKDDLLVASALHFVVYLGKPAARTATGWCPRSGKSSTGATVGVGGVLQIVITDVSGLDAGITQQLRNTM